MESKKTVAIVGSGVIGEAAGKGFHELGVQVIFADIDSKKLDRLAGEGLTAIHVDELREHHIDVFLVSIQTPTVNGKVDTTHLEKAYESVGNALRAQKDFSVVATRSTVPVGTAQTLALQTLEKHSGKKAGTDFGIASNPEYLRENSAFADFQNPRLIVIGADEDISAQKLTDLYKPFGVPIHVVSTKEAELQKYIHNLFNATKISFFNEQRRVCEQLGVSADNIFSLVVETAEAQWNQRYGTKNLGPYGGACLPKDVKGFLSYVKEETGEDLLLLRSVDAVNELIKEEQLDA